jgi:hypothetical protein
MHIASNFLIHFSRGCKARAGRSPLTWHECIGASRKSALEKLTRGYAEKLEDEVIDPCLVSECLDRTLVLMRAWFRN